jgi:hypothetical protein
MEARPVGPQFLLISLQKNLLPDSISPIVPSLTVYIKGDLFDGAQYTRGWRNWQTRWF